MSELIVTLNLSIDELSSLKEIKEIGKTKFYDLNNRQINALAHLCTLLGDAGLRYGENFFIDSVGHDTLSIRMTNDAFDTVEGKLYMFLSERAT